MQIDFKYLLCAVAITLTLIYSLKPEGNICKIVVTGESAVVHNCPITAELAEALKYLKPAEHRSL